MRDRCHEVLDAACAAGIRWVDVARSYGLAEVFLAGWLTDRDMPDMTIPSKWGYTYVGGWRVDADVHEIKEHSLNRFTEQWSERRALLGERVAVYQVHSLTSDSSVFADQPLLEALAPARPRPRIEVTRAPGSADGWPPASRTSLPSPPSPRRRS